MGEEEAPEGVCGYEYDPKGLPEQWQRSCCIRKTLSDNNYCVWHADPETSEKTVETLQEARASADEREVVSSRRTELLDGAKLSGMNLQNRISFEDAYLRKADLSDAYLPEVNLVNTYFLNASISGANLWNADLSGARLHGTDLSESFLDDANLSNAKARGADLSDVSLITSNLSNSDFRETDLHNVLLFSSDLSNSNFAYADLSKTQLYRVDLAGASLQHSNLKRTDLAGANLQRTELHGALLKDVRIDRNTQFGEHYADELDGGTTEDFDKAAWSYRQIQRLFEENAFPKKAREAKVERKDLRRREHWAKAPVPSLVRRVVAWEKRAVGRLKRGVKHLVNRSDEEGEKEEDGAPQIDRPLKVDEKGGLSSLRRWAWLALSGFVSRYSESPRRVVGVSLLTIVAFGLLYPLFGGMETATSSTTRYAFYTATFTVPEQLETFFYNLYFSAVTFTTLGYGDIQPATPATQTLASVQSFIGALLMALLVYVFGRQSVR